MTNLVKKKRVSKKKKIAWRKHINISDVEEYLEEKRLEERLGTPFDKRTNDDIFSIDTQPISAEVLSKKQKREKIANSLPKCFSHLVPCSNVPDPISKRNRIRTPEERKSALMKRCESERKERGIIPNKVLERIKSKAELKDKKKKKWQIGKIKEDIWEVKDEKEDVLNNEWLDPVTKTHFLKNTGTVCKAIPKSIHVKNSILPSIEPPHPGTSYNPSFKDHQALLQMIAEKEAEIIKEEQHLDRVTKAVYKKCLESDFNENRLAEMSQGLPNQTDENENESSDDGEYHAVNPPVVNRKKDRKRVRIAREKKLKRARLAKEKIEKDKVKDLENIESLTKKLDGLERKLDHLKEIRRKREEKKKLQTKRLSSTKFKKPDIEFNLASDIAGNLRNVQTEGNLLLDRFKSLQQRNILEPTVLKTRKRGKKKRFVRSTHKTIENPIKVTK